MNQLLVVRINDVNCLLVLSLHSRLGAYPECLAEQNGSGELLGGDESFNSCYLLSAVLLKGQQGTQGQPLPPHVTLIHHEHL